MQNLSQLRSIMRNWNRGLDCMYACDVQVGHTTFTLACYLGHLEVAKWLADVKGASVADKTNVGSQLTVCLCY